MGGSVYGGRRGSCSPQAEYNIRCDPEAARGVFESGADITVAPLDATATLELSDERLGRIARSASPLAKAMTELLPLWRAHSRHNPILYDPFAAALLIDPSLGRMEKMGIQVTDSGMTRPAQAGRSSARVCLEAHEERFFEFFMSRLTASPVSH
jgi:inosine-uridine nucleoside N-ribohydrolase